VSYFDHDLPDFSVDGNVTIADGLSAAPSSVNQAPDFPAYWNSTIRQYLYYDGHNGYDYDLWYQPVYAAAPGRVIFAAFEYPDAPDHGYGQMVMINHGHGYVTLYGHFSRLLVHKGERVRRGQEIGISGNTGHSSGPHLHFTVFHNCTPTDPYGWTGSGTDPLTQYQGEASVWLWRDQPLVANPLPGWPGMNLLPAGDVTRIVLLRLPGTSLGPDAFTRGLTREEDRTAAELRRAGLSVTVDPLKAALVVRGSISAAHLLSLRSVVSITTPDTEEGERSEVMAALAQSTLHASEKPVRVARSPRWSALIVRWRGHAVLVGRGVPGQQVVLDLEHGGNELSVKLQADPKNGAYAADLGVLSARSVRRLRDDLAGRGSGGSSVKMRTVTPARSRVRATRPRGAEPVFPAAIPVLLLGCLAAGAAFALRRRLGADA